MVLPIIIRTETQAGAPVAPPARDVAEGEAGFRDLLAALTGPDAAGAPTEAPDDPCLATPFAAALPAVSVVPVPASLRNSVHDSMPVTRQQPRQGRSSEPAMPTGATDGATPLTGGNAIGAPGLPVGGPAEAPVTGRSVTPADPATEGRRPDAPAGPDGARAHLAEPAASVNTQAKTNPATCPEPEPGRAAAADRGAPQAGATDAPPAGPGPQGDAAAVKVRGPAGAPDASPGWRPGPDPADDAVMDKSAATRPQSARDVRDAPGHLQGAPATGRDVSVGNVDRSAGGRSMPGEGHPDRRQNVTVVAKQVPETARRAGHASAAEGGAEATSGDAVGSFTASGLPAPVAAPVHPTEPHLTRAPAGGPADVASAPDGQTAGAVALAGPEDAAPARGTQTTPPADLPVHRQLTVRLAEGRAARSVEVQLAPEELGRVTMHVSGDGGVHHVGLIVERAETLDLLRRNADLLAQDFRDFGLRSPTFSFAHEGAGQRRPQPARPATPRLPDAPDSLAAAPVAASPPAVAAGGRLDLRY